MGNCKTSETFKKSPLSKAKKHLHLYGDFMYPKCYHKSKIWRLMKSPNLKYLIKSEYFFGTFSVQSD